jgi:hypothetical protein
VHFDAVKKCVRKKRGKVDMGGALLDALLPHTVSCGVELEG